jgi:hypothetical protein
MIGFIAPSFLRPRGPTAPAWLPLRNYSGKIPAAPAQARKRSTCHHSAGSIPQFLTVERSGRKNRGGPECSKQGILLPGTAIQDPIDEERGCSLHSAAFATFHIFLDVEQRALVHHIACVLLQVETERLGEAGQVGVLQCMLVMEDVIMHLPKLPL